MEADFNRKYGDSGRVARLKNSASSMGAALSGVAAEVKQFQTNVMFGLDESSGLKLMGGHPS